MLPRSARARSEPDSPLGGWCGIVRGVGVQWREVHGDAVREATFLASHGRHGEVGQAFSIHSGRVHRSDHVLIVWVAGAGSFAGWAFSGEKCTVMLCAKLLSSPVTVMVRVAHHPRWPIDLHMRQHPQPSARTSAGWHRGQRQRATRCQPSDQRRPRSVSRRPRSGG